MASPPDGMGRRQILFSNAKAPGQNDRALFAVAGPKRGGPVLMPRLLQSQAADSPGGRRMMRGILFPARTVRREEPGQFLAGLLASGGPASEGGDLHADQKKRFWKGGGKADQGRARYDEGSYGHRELAGGRTFSRKGFPPPSPCLRILQLGQTDAG